MNEEHGEGAIVIANISELLPLMNTKTIKMQVTGQSDVFKYSLQLNFKAAFTLSFMD